MRQPQWSIFEAAILLDGYLDFKNNQVPKMRIVKNISNKLRKMATNAGLVIDDVYRNENGISYQIQSMDSAYVGHKVYVHATKLFITIVEMYHNNRCQYEKILMEANNMIATNKSNKEPFLLWSASQASINNSKWIESNLEIVEKAGNKMRILHGNLFDISDITVVDLLIKGIMRNKIFQIINKKIYKYILRDLNLYRDYLYKHQKDNVEEDITQTVLKKHITVSKKNKYVYSTELMNITEDIISTCFVNGMRINSNIAKKKFKNAYFEQTGIELSENINIDDLATQVGYEYSNKIYAISVSNQNIIRELIYDVFKSGNHVIYYDEMHEKNIDFMTAAGIFSPELLKNILKKMLPEFYYKRSYFSRSDNYTLDMDIMTCFKDKIMFCYNDIKNALPYANMEQIRLICSRNNKFVWAKEETYALAEKLQLSKSDIDNAKNIISYDISKHGFSVIQHITTPISAEMNPDVPEIALKEAIYSLYIAPNYERKHSIITLPGTSFSPSEVMNEYCKNLSETTLSELYEYEKALTNKISHSLVAAYAFMIRVDKERFVNKESISFDTEAIDTVLSLFVQDQIIPLKRVNSFTSFPEISGYTWNLYLLDSYCKHFSIRFCSMGGPAKSKPVGAVFPAEMKFDSYDELLARVAANSTVLLNVEEVSKYFTDNAYTLRKIDATGIAAEAQQIRLQEE